MSNEQIYYDTLRRIARSYLLTEQLTDDYADKHYGLSAFEALEGAYDNIQAEAEAAIKGKRRPKK